MQVTLVFADKTGDRIRGSERVLQGTLNKLKH
jgi:hypothetical protein